MVDFLFRLKMKSKIKFDVLHPETVVSVIEQYHERQQVLLNVTYYDVGLRILRHYVLDKLGVSGDERKAFERYVGHVQNFAWRARSRSMSEVGHKTLPLYTSAIEEGLKYHFANGARNFIEKMRGIYWICNEFKELLERSEPLLVKKTKENEALAPLRDMFDNPLNQVLTSTGVLLDVFTGTEYICGPETGIYVLRGTFRDLQDARRAALESCTGVAERLSLESKIVSCDMLKNHFCL